MFPLTILPNPIPRMKLETPYVGKPRNNIQFPSQGDGSHPVKTLLNPSSGPWASPSKVTLARSGPLNSQICLGTQAEPELTVP